MRKVLMFMVLLIPINLYAPNDNGIKIFHSEPIDYFDIIANAVCIVESGNNNLAYNDIEQAVGAFQIRPIRVEDYNRRTGKNYKLNDFYSYDLSKECFLYYAKLYDDTETIVRRWNGSGEMTTIYWNIVKEYL